MFTIVVSDSWDLKLGICWTQRSLLGHSLMTPLDYTETVPLSDNSILKLVILSQFLSCCQSTVSPMPTHWGRSLCCELVSPMSTHWGRPFCCMSLWPLPFVSAGIADYKPQDGETIELRLVSW